MIKSNRAALILWGALLLTFCAAVGVGKVFGPDIVLRVNAATGLAWARDFEAQGRVHRAIGEYEDILLVDPANLRVRDLLVDRLISVETLPVALKAAEDGIEVVERSERAYARLLLGRVLVARESWDGALRAYESVLEKLPESGEAHYGKARASEATGSFDEMLSSLSAVGRFAGRDSTETYRAARAGRADLIRRLRSERGQGAEELDRLVRLAQALKENGAWEEAASALAEAEGFGGAPPEALVWLSHAQKAMER